MTIDVTPRPRRPPRWTSMVLAHARLELTMLMRNGEQLLLTVVLPLGLLLVLVLTELIDVGGDDQGRPPRDRGPEHVRPGRPVDVVHGTGDPDRLRAPLRGAAADRHHPAATGFDVLAGKSVAVLAIETAQILAARRRRLRPRMASRTRWGRARRSARSAGQRGSGGRSPCCSPAWSGPRPPWPLPTSPTCVLAGAGVVVPVDQAPPALQPVLELLPSAALAESLRIATITGTVDWYLVAVLVGMGRYGGRRRVAAGSAGSADAGWSQKTCSHLVHPYGDATERKGGIRRSADRAPPSTREPPPCPHSIPRGPAAQQPSWLSRRRSPSSPSARPRPPTTPRSRCSTASRTSPSTSTSTVT